MENKTKWLTDLKELLFFSIFPHCLLPEQWQFFQLPGLQEQQLWPRCPYFLVGMVGPMYHGELSNVRLKLASLLMNRFWSLKKEIKISPLHHRLVRSSTVITVGNKLPNKYYNNKILYLWFYLTESLLFRWTFIVRILSPHFCTSLVI